MESCRCSAFLQKQGFLVERRCAEHLFREFRRNDIATSPSLQHSRPLTLRSVRLEHNRLFTTLSTGFRSIIHGMKLDCCHTLHQQAAIPNTCHHSIGGTASGPSSRRKPYLLPISAAILNNVYSTLWHPHPLLSIRTQLLRISSVASQHGYTIEPSSAQGTASQC